MISFSFIRRSLLIALACAAPFFVVGWLVVTRASGEWAAAGSALFGIVLFITGAVIVAPAIAEWITEPRGSLYTPSGHADHPAPLYGIAETLRDRGDYEGALARLDEIAKDFPHELDAYIKMIDIAMENLRDLPRAETLYHRGTQALRNHGDKTALTLTYQALAAHHRDPAHPHPLRPLHLPSKARLPVIPRDPTRAPPRANH